MRRGSTAAIGSGMRSCLSCARSIPGLSRDWRARVVGARHGAKLDLPGGIVVERDGALTTVGRSGVEGRASAGANWATGVSLSVPGAVRLGEEGPRLLALECGEPGKGRADG